MVRLLERHGAGVVEAAIVEALQRNSPRLETIALLLRCADTVEPPVWPAVEGGASGAGDDAGGTAGAVRL